MRLEAGSGEASELDWIERTLHISPDGGTGITEAAITVLVVVALSIVLLRLLVRRRS